MFLFDNFPSSEIISEFVARGNDKVVTLSSHFYNNYEEIKKEFLTELKQFCNSVNCEEYPIMTAMAKIPSVILLSHAWQERTGKAIKKIKMNKRSSLKNDTFNAVLVISLNGPCPGTPDDNPLMKRAAKSYGQSKQYTKAHCMNIRVNPLNANFTKIVRHTQTIRRLLPTI